MATLVSLMITSATFGVEIHSGDATRHPVHIQSEELVVDLDGHTAEFSGQVQIVDHNSTLLADRVTIFFSLSAEEENRLEEEISAANIRQMAARGKVSIRQTDGIAAEAEEAILEYASSQITLLGTEAVVSGSSFALRSARIILYREKGELTAEGGTHGRVRLFVNAPSERE